jgi:hypothetical protein
MSPEQDLGHPTHRSKMVKDCIDSFKGQSEVYTLPSYSPGFNPADQVWNNVKNQGVGRKKVFGPDQLKSLVTGQYLVVLLMGIHILPGFCRLREVDYYRDDPIVGRLMGFIYRTDV